MEIPRKFHGSSPQSTPKMEFKKTFTPIEDMPDAPNKLIARAETDFRYLDRIDIFRVTTTHTTSVNTIMFRRDVAGHPVDDPVALASGVMQVILAHASAEGPAKYRCAFWYNNLSEPYKRMFTLASASVRAYLDEEELTDRTSETPQESALDLARNAMQVVSDTVSDGLKQSYAHNEELHARLIDHSQSSTIAIDNMQKLVGTLTEQLRDAAIIKDRALESIYTTRAAEVEAQASRDRLALLGDAVRPGFMILANQLGAKFGVNAEVFMSPEEKAAAHDTAAEKQAKKSAPPEDVAARKAEILARMKTHPLVCQLSELGPSVSIDQWHHIYAIKPAATGAKVGGMLRALFTCTEEDSARMGLTDLTDLIGGHPKVLTALTAVLNPDQQKVVVSLLTATSRD